MSSIPPSFILISRIPTRGVNDLDALRCSFKVDLPIDDAVAAAPANYTPDDKFPLMFLVDVQGRETGPSASEVDLIYKGTFVEGRLPAPISSTRYAIQQASVTNFPGHDAIQIHLTYIAPSSSKRIFSNTPIAIGTIGPYYPADPADCTVVWWTATWVGTPSPLPVTAPAALDWFVQKKAVLGEDHEVVPGEFYTGSQTIQNLLFSTNL